MVEEEEGGERQTGQAAIEVKVRGVIRDVGMEVMCVMCGVE